MLRRDAVAAENVGEQCRELHRGAVPSGQSHRLDADRQARRSGGDGHRRGRRSRDVGQRAPLGLVPVGARDPVDVDGAAEAVMVLVVVAGCCGRCDRKQQHVELFEEPHPARRDLPTGRVAQQPGAMTLDRAPQCGAGITAGMPERAQGKGSAGARLIVERSTEKAPITKLRNRSCEVAESTGDAGGLLNDPCAGVL